MQGRRILGNPSGPTVITVNGVNAVASSVARGNNHAAAVAGGAMPMPHPNPQVAAAQAAAAAHYDSLLFSSIDEPEER